MTDVIKGFKGFEKDMTCRGYQFKEGESYHEDGPVKACERGFHFCENPIDIFQYYNPSETIFHEVDGSGKIDKHGEDSKIACSDITIKASISLHNLILAGVDFMFKRKYKSKTSKHSTGYRSASSATGNRSASSATGESSASSATGERSASSATGYSSASVCTGLYSKGMAGKYGCIALAWDNKKEDRVEMRCAEIGCGDGSDGKLKEETWYMLDETGSFVETN